MVLSVITASGSSNAAFRSKWTCRGSASCVRPGAQWWGRNQTETMEGGATGPPVSAESVVQGEHEAVPGLQSELGGIERCSVQSDRRVGRGGVLARTDEGEIDASIQTQLTRVREIVSNELGELGERTDDDA